MPTGTFASWIEGLLSGTAYDLTTAFRLYVALIPKGTDEPDLDNEVIVFVSHISGAVEAASHRARVQNVTVGSTAAKVLDADDTVFTAPTTSANQMNLVLYYSGGTDEAEDSENRNIAYWDLGANAPTPAGNDITVAWNASGILKLG